MINLRHLKELPEDNEFLDNDQVRRWLDDPKFKNLVFEADFENWKLSVWGDPLTLLTWTDELGNPMAAGDAELEDFSIGLHNQHKTKGWAFFIFC